MSAEEVPDPPLRRFTFESSRTTLGSITHSIAFAVPRGVRAMRPAVSSLSGRTTPPVVQPDKDSSTYREWMAEPHSEHKKLTDSMAAKEEQRMVGTTQSKERIANTLEDILVSESKINRWKSQVKAEEARILEKEENIETETQNIMRLAEEAKIDHARYPISLSIVTGTNRDYAEISLEEMFAKEDLDTNAKWDAIGKRELGKRASRIEKSGFKHNPNCVIRDFAIYRRRIEGERETVGSWKGHLQHAWGYDYAGRAEATRRIEEERRIAEALEQARLAEEARRAAEEARLSQAMGGAPPDFVNLVSELWTSFQQSDKRNFDEFAQTFTAPSSFTASLAPVPAPPVVPIAAQSLAEVAPVAAGLAPIAENVDEDEEDNSNEGPVRKKARTSE